MKWYCDITVVGVNFFSFTTCLQTKFVAPFRNTIAQRRQGIINPPLLSENPLVCMKFYAKQKQLEKYSKFHKLNEQCIDGDYIQFEKSLLLQFVPITRSRTFYNVVLRWRLWYVDTFHVKNENYQWKIYFKNLAIGCHKIVDEWKYYKTTFVYFWCLQNFVEIMQMSKIAGLSLQVYCRQQRVDKCYSHHATCEYFKLWQFARSAHTSYIAMRDLPVNSIKKIAKYLKIFEKWWKHCTVFRAPTGVKLNLKFRVKIFLFKSVIF